MKSALILFIGALALAAPTQEHGQSAQVSFPRKRHQHVRRADGSVDLNWFKSTLKTTILKYDSGFQSRKSWTMPVYCSSAIPTRKSTSQTSSRDIGAAKQTFTFDFDTGSSDTFVPGPQCGTAQGCDGNTKYDQQGKDEHNTTTVVYGSGQVAGENYFDSVTVAGLTATHQNIISLTQAQGFSGTGSDSLMGMAFQSIANSQQPPFFFTLINEGKVSPTEFSFYLGRQKSGTAQNSELTLGGRDSSKYTGAVTSVPVTSQTYWQVAIDAICALPQAVCLQLVVLIDTGTTLIVAPYAAAISIFAQIPGSIPLPLGASIPGFAYPCASKPQVHLQFAGKNFVVNPLDFNFGTLSEDFGIRLGNDTLSSIICGVVNSYCVAGIAGADLNPTSTENFYVVGDTFLKNWYSTFQYVNPQKAYDFAKAV
ncbi:hypothetical protein CERZMDRAFT_82538 [Cercospora zeae-maydis SCOH1-5]|uniref:Peptidase A1 domain-containing protein n=1 Tax=Cercospora zeae-maydis SCOH1-5 TaxID=717836 RepID=A0A6A6FMC9_9PEZI|nr:hypothetical protein CERZMDRAFT_82538 [Cercospora zeae-maydis SCOH1-5]